MRLLARNVRASRHLLTFLECLNDGRGPCIESQTKHADLDHYLQPACSSQGAVSILFTSLLKIPRLILIGQARHGGCLFRVGSVRPGNYWRVDDGAASVSDSAAAQELENHTNFATNSGSTPRVNSGDH